MTWHPWVNEHHKLDSVGGGGGDDKVGGYGEVGSVSGRNWGEKWDINLIKKNCMKFLKNKIIICLKKNIKS